MNFSECEARGLIRKDSSASSRVPGSLDTSARFLSAARKNIGIREFEMAEIAAYNSAFHSARALLFSLGYLERSHACLTTALNHLIRDDEEIRNFISTLDKLRLSRHNVQYGGSLVLPDEAAFAADFAGRFHEAVSARLTG
ncbi:MAG: HEPN domain-containing protein [Methanoregulaceae archaeon]